ncbi:uncharacterized protein NEMAJ01_0851 [Nematocida major]|uniref:uncharacterized protein n=1 Tax=Nematocida major TaxID=1912982 RepID=UPI002008492D|nr:uncharacterized protein NEMAJ01_0851 [Nematocida major]KAH9385955.1 hypothetical protein NEMAJ01_0851 [Nematocida major]
MFQTESSGQTSHTGAAKKRESVRGAALFDKAVLALISLELARPMGSLFQHCAHLFVCGVLVFPFAQDLTKSEAFACFGAIHWVMQRTQISGEIFYTLLARNQRASLACCMHRVGMYGIKSLFADIKTPRGLLLWMQSAYFILMCVLGLRLLFRANSSANAKRKFLHLGIFLYYYIFPQDLLRVHSVCILFLMHAFSQIMKVAERAYNISERDLLSSFLTEKDRKGIVSHILLVAAFLFVLEGLSGDRARTLFVLSSLGIVDAVSCFFPKSPNTHKSKLGSIVGGILAKCVLSAMGVDYPLWMYFVLGLGEFYAHMNDNILLPILAVGVSSIRYK